MNRGRFSARNGLTRTCCRRLCSLSVGVRHLFFMNTVAAKYTQPVHAKVLNLLYVRGLQRIMEAPCAVLDCINVRDPAFWRGTA